jgi:predicted glycosyltransferase
MITALAQENTIKIVPRDQQQSEHFNALSRNNSNIIVLSDVQTVDKIADDCDLFLGAGGSMTREFAVMGIPTVSMYQDALLEVDKYLIKNNLLISEKDPTKINLQFINKIIKADASIIHPQNDMLEKGKEARRVINEMIEGASR